MKQFLQSLAVVATFALPSSAWAAYTPPYGIPAPPFGIDEVAGPPTQATITNPIPAGAVVQLPPGTRSGGTWTANGTAEQPVFVRGADCTLVNPTVVTGQLTLAGSYFIVECVTLVGDVRLTYASSSHHVAFRHGAVLDYPTGRGSFVQMSGQYGVLYQNEIARNGCRADAGQPAGSCGGTNDHHGVTAGSGSTHTWMLGNHIHHNGGDGIQFCHGCAKNGAPNDGPAHVYIGGNDLHDNRENALDFKEYLGPLIVSTNRQYNHRGTSTSNGENLRLNDEGLQGEIWIVQNEFGMATGNCISVAGSKAWKAGLAHIWGNTFSNCAPMAQEHPPVLPPGAETPPPAPLPDPEPVPVTPGPDPDPTPPLPTPVPEPPAPAPEPEDIQNVRLAAGTVTIAFETEVPARCKVFYGPTATEFPTTLESSYRLAHNRIVDVPPGLTYFYTAHCSPKAGIWLKPTPKRTVTGATGGS